MIQHRFTIGQYRIDIMLGRYRRLTTYKPTAYVKRVVDAGPDFPPGWWISIQLFRCYLDIDIRKPSQKERPRIYTDAEGNVYSVHEARLMTSVERQILFGFDPFAQEAAQ